jgi:hypothetical protein
MRINDTGVGIGTASVDNKLHLENAGTLYLQIENTSTANKFYLGNSGGNAILESTGAYSMNFKTNGSEAARFDSNGNLLINHTATGDWTNTSGAQIRATGLGIFTQSASSAVIANRLSTDGTILDLRKDGTTVGSIGVDSSRLTIGNGDVGLKFSGDLDNIQPHNTTTNGLRDNAISLGASSNRFKDAYFSGTVYADQFLGQNDTNTGIAVGGNDVIQLSTAGSEKARVDSSGNWHFNTTSNDSAVDGTVLRGTHENIMVRTDGHPLLLNRQGSSGQVLEFRYANTTRGTVSVNTSGTTYNTTSDIRLKQDIEPIADGTDKLMAMNPVSYNWKADPDGPRSMGFIAQEMQEVMPEAVAVGDDEDAMMSMDYGRITPILVSALQDAHRKIEELEARIAALEAK